MMVVPSNEREQATAPAAGDPQDDEAGVAPTPRADGGGKVDEYIGARLRQAFDSVAQQPVPDRFLQLIASLDKA